MADSYPIISVPLNAPNRSEPMGSKRKFWFGLPNQPRQLFKFNRPLHGEDWSEKIACEIAELLGVPHAAIDLAEYEGESGIVTPDFRHGRGQLTHGNELMVEFLDPQYPAKGPNFRIKQHTVENVLRVLAQPFIGPPSALRAPSGVVDAQDAFVGYLLLDALIANTDRHHENWAIIRLEAVGNGGPRAELAPTFDHASSLGRELLDTDRAARLDGRDVNRTVERYLVRGECRFYEREEDARPVSPVRAFQVASALRPDAAKGWRERLREVGLVAMESVVRRVPGARMNDLAKRFAIRMLHLNTGALLAD